MRDYRVTDADRARWAARAAAAQAEIDRALADLELALEREREADKRVDGRLKFLGYFDDELEAARAYDRAAHRDR